MGVPELLVVNVGLAATFAGAGLLLLIALWWSWAGDGIGIPRERWPRALRLAGAVGWTLFVGGLLVQIVGYFGPVGVARF
ncbi:MAG: hypothetical protein ACREMB_25335 [Candidatus Rokuibacteriota bacterium]